MSTIFFSGMRDLVRFISDAQEILALARHGDFSKDISFSRLEDIQKKLEQDYQLLSYLSEACCAIECLLDSDKKIDKNLDAGTIGGVLYSLDEIVEETKKTYRHLVSFSERDDWVRDAIQLRNKNFQKPSLAVVERLLAAPTPNFRAPC